MRNFNYPELLDEIIRVKTLLKDDRSFFTQRQNRKYLEKLEKRRKEFESKLYGKNN